VAVNTYISGGRRDAADLRQSGVIPYRNVRDVAHSQPQS